MNNLFKILVLGGAALTAQASFAVEPSAPIIPNQVKLAPVFCDVNNSEICVATVVDNKCALAPKAGLECCWNTSCE